MNKSLERLLRAAVSEVACEPTANVFEIVEVVLKQLAYATTHKLKELATLKITAMEETNQEVQRWSREMDQIPFGEDGRDAASFANAHYEDNMDRVRTQDQDAEHSARHFAGQLLGILAMQQSAANPRTFEFTDISSVIDFILSQCEFAADGEDEDENALWDRTVRLLLSRGDYSASLPQPRRWKDMSDEERLVFKEPRFGNDDDIPF